jgi:hypothetical protein
MPEVKDRFRFEFSKPDVSRKMELIAPPLTNNYQLVGTAFDYLLRFFIEYNNQSFIRKDTWIAEQSLSLIEDGFKDNIFTKKKFIIAKKIIETAHTRHSTYLHNGTISDDLIRSSIQLGRLDLVYRIGLYSEYLDSVRNEDIEDLRNLSSILDPKMFSAKRICIINPCFGFGSYLVGGADADLIIDDNLIEIKTTINPKFERDFFNQLIGYLVLKRIAELQNDTVSEKIFDKEIFDMTSEDCDIAWPVNHRINNIGVFFSRFCQLKLIDIRDITNNGQFNDDFIQWFVSKAMATYR